MVRKFLILTLLISTFKTAYSQDESYFAVPTILLNTYATSGGMGETGIALAPKTNAVLFNSSKMAFSDQDGSVSLSYLPLLRNLGIADIYIANLSGYYKINDAQAIGASFRYYGLGNFTITDSTGLTFSDFNPRDFTFDVAYSQKLNKNFGLGANIKFINSNFDIDEISGQKTKTGKSLAFDLSAFYTNTISLFNTESQINAGASISNVGNKMSHFVNKENKLFLPANLGIGAAYILQFSNNSKLTFAYDLNKLLIPTEVLNGYNSDKTVLGGMLSSFADAPFKQEIKELVHSLGVEFWFKDFVAIRSGLHRENLIDYGTFGLSLKYKFIEATASRIYDTDKFSQQHRTTKISILFHLYD